MEEVASRYLFVDMAIKNMELDIRHIKDSLFKIKGPYIELIEKMISEALNERRKLKQMMYKNKIRVELQYKQGQYTTYKFYINGNGKEKTYHNMVIKKNVEEIMRKLLEGN